LYFEQLEPDMGVVFTKHLGTYTVQMRDGRSINCSISSTLRKVLLVPPRDPNSLPYFKVYGVAEIRAVDPVAVGDVVRIREGQNSGGEAVSRTGMISEIVDRQNSLTRRTAGPKPLEQVIAANVDQMVAVVPAAKPVPDLVLLDRYLASAEAAGIPALIVFTKFDQKVRDYVLQAVEDYQRIGYRVLVTSAVEGRGVDEFRDAIHGKVSVLVGVSGAGKTTLLNAAQPGLGLRVKEVNARTGEGRHTTTHLEMFALDDAGGAVIDTPGMREFNLWDIDDSDVIQLFPEMRPHLGNCKFGGRCLHVHEPGCGVKQAVERGDIPEQRYRSYSKMVSHE
jgi:ribosome biogenesis GTPase / thiamine phosphate phosphatase